MKSLYLMIFLRAEVEGTRVFNSPRIIVDYMDLSTVSSEDLSKYVRKHIIISSAEVLSVVSIIYERAYCNYRVHNRPSMVRALAFNANAPFYSEC